MDSAKLYGEISFSKNLSLQQKWTGINALAEEIHHILLRRASVCLYLGYRHLRKKLEPKNLAGHIGYSALVGDVYDFINMDIMIHQLFNSSAFSRVSSRHCTQMSAECTQARRRRIGRRRLWRRRRWLQTPLPIYTHYT